jgi:hypothetical protein
MLSFKCQMKTDDGIERWEGIIPRFENHGSHYEIRIESRSGIMVVLEALPVCLTTTLVAILVISRIDSGTQKDLLLC